MIDSTAKSVVLATRGSALALAQAHAVQAALQAAEPDRTFEVRIYKTSGDKLQTASLNPAQSGLPKGLFTKELEEALLAGEAHLAVHSLKDLPTELPDGLKLGAVLPREDPRDVLVIRRDRDSGEGPAETRLAEGAVVATSSTRRGALLKACRPDLHLEEIRGNVGTRLKKLAESATWSATLLAAAGLNRLGFEVDAEGWIRGEDVPEGLRVIPFAPEVLVPCVGQAAIGLEIREDDEATQALCGKLNDPITWACITAERAFLRAMGGGCNTPVAAHARLAGEQWLELAGVSFLGGDPLGHRASGQGATEDSEALGQGLAKRLLAAGGTETRAGH